MLNQTITTKKETYLPTLAKLYKTYVGLQSKRFSLYTNLNPHYHLYGFTKQKELQLHYTNSPLILSHSPTIKRPQEFCCQPLVYDTGCSEVGLNTSCSVRKYKVSPLI